MKRLFSLLFVAVSLARADTLISIDKTAGVIVIDAGSVLHTYRMKPFTEVRINGNVAPLDLLKPGMQVNVTMSDTQSVARILATGSSTGFGAPPTSSPSASPALIGMGMSGPQSVRRIMIRGKFDDDIIKVRNGVLWIQHVAFDNPTDLSINGIHWKPTWQGSKSENFEFKTPICSFGDSKVKVRKLLGRSEIDSVEPPTAANKQTLSIKIVDKPVGVDLYEISVTW